MRSFSWKSLTCFGLLEIGALHQARVLREVFINGRLALATHLALQSSAGTFAAIGYFESQFKWQKTEIGLERALHRRDVLTIGLQFLAGRLVFIGFQGAELAVKKADG